MTGGGGSIISGRTGHGAGSDRPMQMSPIMKKNQMQNIARGNQANSTIQRPGILKPVKAPNNGTLNKRNGSLMKDHMTSYEISPDKLRSQQ